MYIFELLDCELRKYGKTIDFTAPIFLYISFVNGYNFDF